MRHFLCGIVLFSTLFAPLAVAEPKHLEIITTGDLHVALALGYGGLENPRAHAKAIKTYVLPTWSYYGERFYVENFTLGYSLYESDSLQLDIQTQLNDDGIFFEFDGLNKLFMGDILGITPIKQPINEKYPSFDEIERNISYLGGINITWLTELSDISLGYFHDITGVHQGNEIQLRLKRSFEYTWGALGFMGGTVRKNQNILNYYYQLTPEERGPINSHYYPSATLNYYAKAVVNVPLGENVNFVGILEYTWLGQAITDSIMIDKDSYVSGFIGISYGF